MRLVDLFKQCDVLKLIEETTKIHLNKSSDYHEVDREKIDHIRDGYTVAVSELVNLMIEKNNIGKDEELSITVRLTNNQTEVEKFGDEFEEYVDVGGIKKGDTENYAIELTDWKDLLSQEVIVEESLKSKLSDLQVMAEILWEITFFGYTNDEVQKQRDEINARWKEIEEGKVKLIEYKSVDDLMKELEKSDEGEDEQKD